MNEELANYIKQAKESGMSDDEISSELLKAGWGESVVQDLFSADKKQKNIAEKSKRNKKNKVKIALLIILVILIIPIIFFVFNLSNTGLSFKNLIFLNKKNIVEIEVIKPSKGDKLQQLSDLNNLVYTSHSIKWVIAGEKPSDIDPLLLFGFIEKKVSDGFLEIGAINTVDDLFGNRVFIGETGSYIENGEQMDAVWSGEVINTQTQESIILEPGFYRIRLEVPVASKANPSEVEYSIQGYSEEFEIVKPETYGLNIKIDEVSVNDKISLSENSTHFLSWETKGNFTQCYLQIPNNQNNDPEYLKSGLVDVNGGKGKIQIPEYSDFFYYELICTSPDQNNNIFRRLEVNITNNKGENISQSLPVMEYSEYVARDYIMALIRNADNYYNRNNSYKGYCLSQEEMLLEEYQKEDFVCYDNIESYALTLRIGKDNFRCIDPQSAYGGDIVKSFNTDVVCGK